MLPVYVAAFSMASPTLGEAYFAEVYGAGAPALAYDDVDVVQLGRLSLADRVKFAPMVRPTHSGLPRMLWCPQRGGMVFGSPYFPACMGVVARHAAGARTLQAPTHAWIEVMHGTNRGDAIFNESAAAWFYFARGSGVYAYTGNTKVYADHGAAAADLLNETCPWLSWCQCTECDHLFGRMWTEAARRGYDSIQFTKHCDMSCAPELCLTEVVLIGTDGSSSCPTTLRRGMECIGAVRL